MPDLLVEKSLVTSVLLFLPQSLLKFKGCSCHFKALSQQLASSYDLLELKFLGTLNILRRSLYIKGCSFLAHMWPRNRLMATV